jgi:chromosomal replication initiator protein
MGTAWQQTLDILRKSLNPGLFQVWIKPLEAEFQGKTLRIYAPNEFVASWVRDRLSESIAEAACQAVGKLPEVEVAVRNGRKPAGNNGNGSAKEQSEPHLALPGIAQVKSFSCPVWRFSFDDFVVGPCNELAFTAARGVSDGMLASEQLFICSSPGLGKTHLLHSIGRCLASRANKRMLRVAYLTAEEFTSRMIMAIKARETDKFKARFRNEVDVLLLEDIHFLQGKPKTQDELLSTLKALQERGCKVVFSSSFLPRELKDVDSHLSSRLCAGFLANIERPDFAMRCRILRQKAASVQVSIPDQVSELLAERITTDVRQLESCLNSLLFKAKLLNRHIDLEMAGEVLRNYAPPEQVCLGLEQIVDFVCETFELKPMQLSSKSRKRQVVMARNTAFYLARKHTDLSLQQIGSQFNRRHSTVLKGITNVEREISRQSPVGRQLGAAMQKLRT